MFTKWTYRWRNREIKKHPSDLLTYVPFFFLFILFYFIYFYLFNYYYYYFFTLQYCIHFAIHHHASTTGVYVFPILNPPPNSLPIPSFWSSQCTSPKLLVSCIKPGLAIHFLYDIIHVLMPFSQIFPPSPSPTESKRLLYTSVSLLLSCIQAYRYHLSKFHIYMH